MCAIHYSFLFKCFLVGFSAASAVGPIFVLTFNRGAIYGFIKGFATGLGAAMGDGFLFFLGLLGVLNFFEESKRISMAFDIIGGLLLIYVGVRMFRGRQKFLSALEIGAPKRQFFSTMSKSLLLTLVNPMTILFFMFIGIKMMPEGIDTITWGHIITGGLAVFCGSLTLLACIAFIASRLGNVISPRRLVTISHTTGVFFVGIGLYFISNFVVQIFVLCKSFFH
jgi:threonine/homoserine/homoserine lactone efflux protein